MRTMSKITLVDAAIAGGNAERIPFSIWHHFPPTAVGGKASAQAHIAHYRRYDLDYLKVMNDNPYDMPRAMPSIERAKDWFKLEPLSSSAPGFASALETVNDLCKEVGRETRYVITVFGPMATAMKISKSHAVDHLREDPEAFEKGLDTIANSLVAFSKSAIDAGASGVFFAASGAEPTMLTEEEYRRFVKPHDLTVMTAVQTAPFNILHVHGTDVYLDLFFDYPAGCLNWPSHKSAWPIAKVRKKTDKCLIAGIDERGPIATGKMRATIAEVDEAFHASGRRKFMYGPECAVPPETPPDVISGIRDLIAQM